MLNEKSNTNSEEKVKRQYDLTSEEDINKINIKQLLRLEGNIEKAIDKKKLSIKLENFEEKNYVTVKLKDYMTGYKNKQIKLMISDNNIVEGYNQDIDRLIIGKIINENEVFLLDFNTAVPRLKCYEGIIDFDKRKVNGYISCKECLNSFVMNMNILNNTNLELDKLPNDELDYKELKYHIKKLEQDIITKVRYTLDERKLLLMVKEMN